MSTIGLIFFDNDSFLAFLERGIIEAQCLLLYDLQKLSFYQSKVVVDHFCDSQM